MLARRSVLGLVLSGHADAAATLEDLVRTMRRDDELRALLDDLLPGLMPSARLIQSKGLAKYYGE
jgi:hypothetical protein